MAEGKASMQTGLIEIDWLKQFWWMLANLPSAVLAIVCLCEPETNIDNLGRGPLSGGVVSIRLTFEHQVFSHLLIDKKEPSPL